MQIIGSHLAYFCLNFIFSGNRICVIFGQKVGALFYKTSKSLSVSLCTCNLHYPICQETFSIIIHHANYLANFCLNFIFIGSRIYVILVKR